MAVAYAYLGEWVTIILMALALGMDAFSLGIGIGMKGIRKKEILLIASVVAFFHILMPLLGVATGQYVGRLLGELSQYVAGGLLAVLGGHMIYNALKDGEVQMISHQSFLGILLFSLSVSIDSFSIGITLGMFHANLWLIVLLFGFCGGLLSMSGLMLGKKVGRNLGEYGEAVGGAILLAFGLLFIF
ncbi:manganese efflux pump MntP family protein [Paenibacillus turicensis]|uniref:manganese efflux pump MntP n=1 Tax=Paenibacillus turicensis TaxID=160487 RepID=UPI003D28B5DB